MSGNYVCPHCGADDSTRCAKLKPVECYPRIEYPPAVLNEAREVGCRVAYYVDLAGAEA